MLSKFQTPMDCWNWLQHMLLYQYWNNKHLFRYHLRKLRQTVPDYQWSCMLYLDLNNLHLQTYIRKRQKNIIFTLNFMCLKSAPNVKKHIKMNNKFKIYYLDCLQWNPKFAIVDRKEIISINFYSSNFWLIEWFGSFTWSTCWKEEK